MTDWSKIVSSQSPLEKVQLIIQAESSKEDEAIPYLISALGDNTDYTGEAEDPSFPEPVSSFALSALVKLNGQQAIAQIKVLLKETSNRKLRFDYILALVRLKGLTLSEAKEVFPKSDDGLMDYAGLLASIRNVEELVKLGLDSSLSSKVRTQALYCLSMYLLRVLNDENSPLEEKKWARGVFKSVGLNPIYDMVNGWYHLPKKFSKEWNV